MFQPWRTEDFLPAVVRAPEPADFWEPKTNFPQSSRARLPHRVPANDFWEALQHPQPPAPSDLQGAACAFDFWDPIPAREAEAVSPVSDWSEAIVLPLYEAHASENPFRFEEARPSVEAITRRRARWLASLLDIPTMRARRWFADKFEELFDEFPHHNTFHALSGLAIDGASADEILASFQLRQAWTDNPIFWSIRRKGYRGPIIPNWGERQLGWTKAICLSNLAKGLPAEQIIDQEWYEEWLRLPYGDPLFWSFLEYATARLESFSKGVLAVPETLAHLEESIVDELKTRSVSIDGMKVGSRARTGLLVRLQTDAISFGCQRAVKSKNSQYQAEAAQ